MIRFRLQRFFLSKSLLLLSILATGISPISAQVPPFIVQPEWSPSGNYVAIAINDRVEVWDTSSQQLHYTLTDHTGLISMVAWSPNNTQIATASIDQTIKLWGATDGALLQTLIGHHTTVTTVIWSPDSTRIVSWGFDTSPNLFVWDARTGILLESYDSGDINDAAFSPDGTSIALLNILGIGTLDSQTFEVISGSSHALCCTNRMVSIAWSPDGDLLVTGSINGLVTVWDAHTSQIRNQFIANPHHAIDSRDVDNIWLSWVRDVVFSPDGETILSISGNGTIRQWATTTGTLIQESQTSQLFTAAWSPYTARLIILSPPNQNNHQLNIEQQFDAGIISSPIQMIVPAPSLDRLQAIAQLCGAPADLDPNPLEDFATHLDTLDIPPACRADLLAIAAVLQTPSGENTHDTP